jgi:two-component system LytT family sensor kinase
LLIEVIKNLINNLGYIILVAFILSRLKIFKKIIQKDEFNKEELIILSLVFGSFGILGTYIGTEIEGAIANTRIIGVMAGGILCGYFVGTTAGIIAAIHRFIVYSNSITTLPCAIATIISGIFAGFLHTKAREKDRWAWGLLGGVLMQSLEMILILLIARPLTSAFKIVKSIYIPMGFTNAIGISILILLIENIFYEKDRIEANQAQIALEIANKTLPYFRDINSDSYDKVCAIIKEYIDASAVSIINNGYVLAHVGLGEKEHKAGSKVNDMVIKKVIKHGELLILNTNKEMKCFVNCYDLNSLVIAPLKDGNKVIGALEIYYSKENFITSKVKNLAVGLSQIMSTQLEISKISKFKEMANKAEIKALQTQINPHFLFNALNTVTSFIRINPDKARELIINLSTYLRYNLEYGDTLVDIYRELEQVKAYVEIEKARFGKKLNVIYKIDDDINIKIPSLIIQPIVENAIKHGILINSTGGTVKITVEKLDANRVKITIEDDGVGIDKEVIKSVYNGKTQKNKIGMINVHTRLKILYGKGLNIERLKKGTCINFIVYKIKE